MSINAIYGCKLYKASHRKDKIRAAANNPINTELVLQLSEYLDDADTTAAPKSSDKPTDTKSDSTPAEERIRPSVHSGGHSAPPMPSGGMDHHLSDELADDKFEPDIGDVPIPEDDVEPEPEDVEESTKVKGTSIQSCTYVATEIDSITGLLNSQESTSGVCRGIVKEDELWLHYNDSINLNNGMEPVIALLNASNYNMLNFNRLARTENAIVFSIDKSSKPVEPIHETADETK